MDARRKQRRCRYCCLPKGYLFRGLCGQCFRNRTRSLEVHPTRALPGSEEKVRVLMERYETGQRLWHADDNLGCDDDVWEGVVVLQRGVEGGREYHRRTKDDVASEKHAYPNHIRECV